MKIDAIDCIVDNVDEDSEKDESDVKGSTMWLASDCPDKENDEVLALVRALLLGDSVERVGASPLVRGLGSLELEAPD